ncbi:Uncharacterised protein [Serratia proteamaculans]|uniref:hypothetical protein n=1 Tax=Serratia proteamaculans TaxID=28151 RepID=UPI0021837DC4|nr:hypothetical protein [Serratia proteamaculans]CAI2456815.1 Uncharacterised protein [Serratia proteamaculans]
MSNSNPSKLTRAELADIYEKLVLYYEQHQGLTSELLSTQVRGYRKLKDELSLQIQPFHTEKELAEVTLPATDNKQNLVWFYNAKGNILKSVFYHLRNAAAHADIERVEGNPTWYHIEHRHRSQLKLSCQMKKTDFWCFVDAAKNLKKTKTGKGAAV